MPTYETLRQMRRTVCHHEPQDTKPQVLPISRRSSRDFIQVRSRAPFKQKTSGYHARRIHFAP